MTQVSIALATFNGAQHIQEQLDSFVLQSKQPDELVICDDGSTDDTANIILEFSKTAPFVVRFIQNEKNIGHVQNFAKSITYCTGDIIFLSDQDDKWWPEKIKTVIDALEENPECWIAVHDGELTDAELTPSGVTKMSQIKAGYGSAQNISTGALSAFRRELLKYALPIPNDITGHDTWLHQLAFLLPGRRKVLIECLQYVRRHDSNTSSWVVNNNRSIGRYDVARAQSQLKPATDYMDRLAINAGLTDGLNKMVVSLGDPVDLRAAHVAKTRLQRELEALQMRQALFFSNPLQRRVSAVHMMISGRYSFFNGYRSFIRDMLR